MIIRLACLTAIAVLLTLTLVACNITSHSATPPPSAPAATAVAATVPPAPPTTQPIPFTDETLPNGLRVVYAPLRQAPIVHVRVIYHVGSRDERPDRQGFAHMFEHMMFRGSAHVPPEQHMKLVGTVGGYCNAFTSFDETVYLNTLPSQYLDMVLYLEADRMASFKVSDVIYKTERKVVAEEWRMGRNRPYGTMWEDFLKAAFTTHSYRWTPIGNMDHLKAAQVSELQDFFNTYYLPNNAVLVIAGDFDVEAAKAMVRRYFGWIPRGPEVVRNIPEEPVQTEARREIAPQRVPLARVMIGCHAPPYRSDDHYALAILGAILGDGNSSRLHRLLISSDHPLCVDVSAEDMQLEDGGVMGVEATLLSGRDPAEVEKVVRQAIADVRERGVTADELAKAKTQQRIAYVQGREKADDVAAQLGEEALFGGDPNRVNTDLPKLEAVTAEQVQAVARKYLQDAMTTTLVIVPDPLGRKARAAATQAQATIDAPVAAPTAPIQPRVSQFPAGYPDKPPMGDLGTPPQFNKGAETAVNGVRVITLSDHRLPLVNWSLTLRRGSHLEPAGKEGLAGITAEMIRRGTADMTYAQLNEDLDARGITIAMNDGQDFTRLSGSCTTDQIDHAIERARQMLRRTITSDEFLTVREQLTGQLMESQETPTAVADHELSHALYGDSPLGRTATPESVSTIQFQDVLDFYKLIYNPDGAILVFDGDIDSDKAAGLAEKLVGGWDGHAMPSPDYTLPPVPSQRRIILIDRPESRQATVRMAIRAYDISSLDKFPGSVAGQILSSGIDSRLGKYVRAEKGLAYVVYGVFQPGRHAGAFVAGTETAVESTADAIDAMLTVFDKMEQNEVTADELSQAKLRVAGGMVMQMQTIQQQAGYRLEGLLNGYPVDYYDLYPQRIAQVTAAQVESAMARYVKDGQMVIVVVAPASTKSQLERFGSVEVLPMPAKRPGAAPRPSGELLQPAH